MRIGSLAIIDFRERTTNALIRLLGCSDRSVPLLFACNKTRLYVFSMGPVLFSISLQCAIPVGKHQKRWLRSYHPGFSLPFVFQESLGLPSVVFESPRTNSKSPM